jgi:(p)ppGpp synthase/HD superfamily hydrolase
MNDDSSVLVLHAIRIAEYAHRTPPRPAPTQGTRRTGPPYYFVHLAEVAWMLSDAGCSHEVIAAGYLHDVIEDCGYTGNQLEEEIGSSHVRDLVEWVTEPDRLGENGKKLPWEVRNRNYLERIKKAPVEALTLSCADKTANIREMCSWHEILASSPRPRRRNRKSPRPAIA